MSFLLVVIAINVAYTGVVKIIRWRTGSFWNILDCRWAFRTIPPGCRYEGPPPSEWPTDLKRKAYWPKRYGELDFWNETD